jgi:charged multivesicular body protein 2A
MGQMNRSLNLPQIQRIMNEFEKESQTMDMKDEMMGDAVDDVMDDEAEGEGEEEEGDKILNEVLDEIGINTSQMVSTAIMASQSVVSAADCRTLCRRPHSSEKHPQTTP